MVNYSVKKHFVIVLPHRDASWCILIFCLYLTEFFHKTVMNSVKNEIRNKPDYCLYVPSQNA